MNDMIKSTDNGSKLNDPALLLQDPNCITCLRKKLRAISVVVFFQEYNNWRIGGYQSDKPLEDAEIDFYCMLKSNIPNEIIKHERGLLLSDANLISKLFGNFANLFKDSCLIGAPVRCDKITGARLAWRDNSEPFSESDLQIIRCTGKCPQ